MKKFFKFGSKGLKRSPSETSNQSSSWSLNSGGSKDSLGKSSSSDFKEKDFHKIHKAALNGDLEKLKEHLKKQSVDLTGLWFYSYDSTLITYYLVALRLDRVEMIFLDFNFYNK